MGLLGKIHSITDSVKVAQAAYDPWGNYDKRVEKMEQKSIALAGKVSTGAMDPIEADILLSGLYMEPSAEERTLNVDPKVSEALARLVEKKDC